MKSSSLRGNVVAVAALYAAALAFVLGCPATNEPARPQAGVPAAIHPHPQAKQPAAIDRRIEETPPTAIDSQEELAVPEPLARLVEETPPAAINSRGEEKQPAATPVKTPSSDFKPRIVPVSPPIQQPIFVGWPKPQLALMISGRQDGYLEPCGCAGLENQKGGLSRRHTLVKQLLAEGWPLAMVDIGNQVRRFGKQAEIQFSITADALRTMGYTAVGLGPGDLRLSAGEVAVAASGVDGKDSIFVSANADLLGLVPKFRIVEIGGKKLGITGVIGSTFLKQVNNSEITLTEPAEAIAQVVPELVGCDVRVLLVYGPPDEAKTLAEKFPQFDVVVTAAKDDVEEPKFPPDKTLNRGKTVLVEAGHKSMYAMVLAWYDDPKHPLRVERVPLDARFKDSPEMHKLKTAYQGQLHELGWKGIGIQAADFPRPPEADKLTREFIGSQSCRECHEAAWDIWRESKHAHATETLEKLDPPRQFDAECVSCHTTGWNPQEFFPYRTGYLSREATPLLATNGCENCHGPGAAHVAAEKGSDKSRRKEFRELMHLDLKTAEEHTCVKCHDLDNSPAFTNNFQKYWDEIAH